MADTRRASSRTPHDGPATLTNAVENRFKLTAICRSCWHRGSTRTPEEWADLFGVSMSTAWNTLPERLVCSACGARDAYFSIDNPAVPGR